MNEVLLGRSGVAVERQTEMEVSFPRKLLKNNAVVQTWPEFSNYLQSLCVARCVQHGKCCSSYLCL